MTDVLHAVVLTPRAAAAWTRAAHDAVRSGRMGVVSVEEIPDEQAEVLSSGCLRIFVEHSVAGVLCELVLPASEWSWME